MNTSKEEAKKQQKSAPSGKDSAWFSWLVDTVSAGGNDGEDDSNSTDENLHPAVWRNMPNSKEFKQALQFIAVEAKDINSRWILKNMPNCAVELQNGTVTVQNFMEKFALGVTFGCKDTLQGKLLTSSQNILNVVWQDAVALTQRAIPTRFAFNAGVDDQAMAMIACEFGMQLLVYFTRAEVKQLGWKEDGMDAFSCPCSLYYPLLLDAVCEEEAPKLDVLFFRGKRGTFLKKCPTYKKEARHFTDLFEDPNRAALRSKRLFKFSCIRRAADAVADGTSHAHKTCWQCSSTGSVMNTCSSCQVAQYCDEKCQRKAWKLGHKTCCADLKKKHDFFETNLEALVSLHESEIREGLEPAYEFDQRAFDDCVDYMDGSIWRGTQFETGLSGPSFSIYAENLRQIRNGQFIWFFPDALPMSEYKANVVGKDGLLHMESNMCFLVRMLMCYDFTEFFEENEVSDATAAAIFKSMLNALLPTKRGQRAVLDIPAERFIELHDQSRGIEGTEKERAAMLRKLHSESERKFVNILRSKDADADTDSSVGANS